MNFIWNLIAFTLARSPRLVDWLIQRAQRTPYSHIPSRDGRGTYMYRWWLFNPYGKDAAGNEQPARWSWLPSIRIHHIRLPDVDRHLHDHPWNARTIVLRGFYHERREDCPHEILRIPGDTARLLFGEYHRITRVSDGGVITCFFTWKYRGDWGFKVNGKKVSWREYLSQQELGIKRGQALVLVGPQGCGKSTKARELAAKFGAYMEIEAEIISSDFRLGNVLAEHPSVVIVNVDRPLSDRVLNTLKSLIASDRWVCHQKRREPSVVRTPKFIFCTCNKDFLPAGDRRFWVVEMPAAATHHHPV